MNEKDEIVCYDFVCRRYPRCARARGKGCSIEWDDTPQTQVQPGECTEENQYPMFVPLD